MTSMQQPRKRSLMDRLKTRFTMAFSSSSKSQERGSAAKKSFAATTTLGLAAPTLHQSATKKAATMKEHHQIVGTLTNIATVVSTQGGHCNAGSLPIAT